MLRKENMILVQDGEKISENFVKDKRLSRLTSRQGESCYISFVGIVLNKQDVIVSVPKHFYNREEFSSNSLLTKEQIVADVKDLLSIIVKGESSISGGKEDNLPIDSYSIVQEFYKKYGLYTRKIKSEFSGYFGRINWKKTVQKSQKVVQNNGILFLPFQLEKKIDISTFISECMEFVLGYTYNYFQQYLDFLTPYDHKIKNPIFNDFKRCKTELQRIRGKLFKDLEKKLIDALIEYFDWLSAYDTPVMIVTKNFELYWEALIAIYLNEHFFSVSSSGMINFEKNLKEKFAFKDKKLKVEDSQLLAIQKRNGFSIEFDHIRFDESEILLFDSKYVKDDKIKGLNYKQAFYYYYLLSQFPGKRIVNGLILPTSSVYSHAVHIDRETKIMYDPKTSQFTTLDKNFIDGLKIIEHKVNLKTVIGVGSKFPKELKINLLKNKN